MRNRFSGYLGERPHVARLAVRGEKQHFWESKSQSAPLACTNLVAESVCWLIRGCGQRGYGLPNSQAARQLASLENKDLVSPIAAPKVLIVEDNLKYAIELLRCFKAAGPEFIDADAAPDFDTALQYVHEDTIDIYIVDLKLGLTEDSEKGIKLVEKILETTKAGVIVHSSIPAEREAVPLLMLGADDYVEKPVKAEILRAKILALWRRIQLTRPSYSKSLAHTGRIFAIGKWRLVIGSRELKSDDDEKVKISSTEHALLRHLCVVLDHEIDRETFNVTILGRRPLEQDKRIDNFVYRLRHKLGGSLQLKSMKDGTLKLMDVQEIKSP